MDEKTDKERDAEDIIDRYLGVPTTLEEVAEARQEMLRKKELEEAHAKGGREVFFLVVFVVAFYWLFA